MKSRSEDLLAGRSYKVPFLTRLYTISVMYGFTIGLIAPIFTLYALNEFSVPIDDVGYIFMLAGLGALPINWISGKLSDKYKRVLMAMTGMLVGTIAFVGIGIFSSIILVMLFFIIRFMAMMFYVPAYRAFQADIIPPIVRGRYFGRIQAVFNLGASSAPIIGGIMYDYLSGKSYQIVTGFSIPGTGLIFEICAMISLLSTIFIYLIFRLYKPEIHQFRQITPETIFDSQNESTLI